MAEYVTLIEAAELEGVKYKTMAQRLNRNPDKFDTMTEKSENGGKDAVLVAVASLSKKARNAWKERAKLKELSGTISPEGEAQPEPEAPWYVEADVDWYIENYREQWYKGMELGNVIREFLQYDGANKPGKNGMEGMRNIMHGMCSYIRQSASCSVIQIGTCEPLPKRWEWRRP